MSSSSLVVCAHTEEPPHASIEWNNLGGNSVDSGCNRDGKNEDRSPLLIEGKQWKEMEKKFLRGKYFPLPGSTQHEQVRNNLLKYIHEAFTENEQFTRGD